ncbi:hypothetical protein MRB53_007392 [Persea americana]|uniref:Uncharacterized protein n=1 Tax=Persea americana TaxID=3435 RepID=A0ACC2MJX8_PERAE|nr:hypothetical protein MRB53_007392 [Persea americana]
MANSESSSTLGSSTPVIHVQSENSGFKAGITLTEVNYDVWSQILEMHIAGREKLEYIMGTTPQPKATDASYAKWYAENQKRAFSTKQVGRPLSTYYGELVEIFQELDHRNKIVMKDPDDVLSYKKSVERLRVHIFLNGLDAEFEQLRGEILRKEPVLDFEETYAYVRRDAIHKTMLNGEPNHPESSAMMARPSKPQQWRTNPKPERASGPPNHTADQNQSSGSQNHSYEIGAARPERLCTHCGGTGHTKSWWYELIGYPEWWDPAKAPSKRNSKPKSHASVAVAEHSNNTPEEASSLIATSGNLGKALNASTPNNNSAWIIDSGATDHMTFDVNYIQSMKPSKQPIVSTANGTPSPVIGEGSITVTKDLNLDSVLVVPSLNYNLLSVAQITCALHCIVIFWPNLCVFKDIRTRRTIGYGTRRGKLYHLDLTPASSNQLAQVFTVDRPKKIQNSEIWLWHRRLGHASFGYLKKLFPKLFSQLTDSDFKCDICELAKSHRVSFPIRMNKSPVPFMVVHSDGEGRCEELQTLNHSLDILDSMSGDNLDNNGKCPDEANGHIQEDVNSQDQIEVVPPVSPSLPTLVSPVSQSPQVPTFPIQSVPFNQLLSEADSIFESQVNSEPPDSISE